jgi:hypothetical protein
MKLLFDSNQPLPTLKMPKKTLKTTPERVLPARKAATTPKEQPQSSNKAKSGGGGKGAFLPLLHFGER